MTIISRRNFGLGSLGAAAAAFMTGAGETSTARRFLFVHAQGGWDPLCVFAPMFDSPQINMEPAAEPVSVGNFDLVASPLRPSVIPFFERWGDQTLVLNGLSTRSVNHETCQIVALTGATSDAGTDWPTMLAVDDAASYYLPHLVLGGPAFAGDQTVYVSRAEGLVQQAVNADLLLYGDIGVEKPQAIERLSVDSYLAGRALAFKDRNRKLKFASEYEMSVRRSQQLTAADLIKFPPAQDLRGQGLNAIQALADGVARCATISSGFNWDTHADNSPQSALFDGLFSDLDFLLDALQTTPTKDGAMLSDDTVVVVLSEMARTPAYNATTGRDHWPYTTAMIVGPGIDGGRTIGGYSELYVGIGVDPTTAELDPNRVGIDAKMFGATLLALGGVDPNRVMTDPEVIEGVLI